MSWTHSQSHEAKKRRQCPSGRRVSDVPCKRSSAVSCCARSLTSLTAKLCLGCCFCGRASPCACRLFLPAQISSRNFSWLIVQTTFPMFFDHTKLRESMYYLSSFFDHQSGFPFLQFLSPSDFFCHICSILFQLCCFWCTQSTYRRLS